MKIIILAAGCGSRLGKLTADKPKCLVEVNKKSILDYQLQAIKKVGIKEEDIIILCGYKEQVLRNRYKNSKMKFISNTEYQNTNMVYTLMCAKNELLKEEKIIICYGDIIYDYSVLEKILEGKTSINVIVDRSWRAYWEERFIDPLLDAESLIIDKEGNIVSIGQKVSNIEDIQAQYIGLIKVEKEALQKMVQYYDSLVCDKANYRKMYMTDFLQDLINIGEKVEAKIIDRKWFEIDSVKDIQIAEKYIFS